MGEITETPGRSLDLKDVGNWETGTDISTKPGNICVPGNRIENAPRTVSDRVSNWSGKKISGGPRREGLEGTGTGT